MILLNPPLQLIVTEGPNVILLSTCIDSKELGRSSPYVGEDDIPGISAKIEICKSLGELLPLNKKIATFPAECNNVNEYEDYMVIVKPGWKLYKCQ